MLPKANLGVYFTFDDTDEPAEIQKSVGIGQIKLHNPIGITRPLSIIHTTHQALALVDRSR